MPALKDFSRCVRNAEHAVLARLPLQHLWGEGKRVSMPQRLGASRCTRQAQLFKSSVMQPRTSLLPSTMAYLYVT